MLALVLVHGVFWSGLLSASAAYMTDCFPRTAAQRDRLLGPLDPVSDCGRADGWILDLSPAAGCGSVSVPPRSTSAWRRLPGRFPSTRSWRRGQPTRGAVRSSFASARFDDARHVFVRLRRHHQFHRDVCRRERCDAEEPLSDRTGDRHAAHQAAACETRGSVRIQACFRPVPGVDLLRPGVPCRQAARVSGCCSRRYLRCWIRQCLSVLYRIRDARCDPAIVVALRSAPFSRRSTQASAPDRRRWDG